MDINPEAWPELLLEFGPYAILALFILWVIPRVSGRMERITATAPRAVRVTAAVTVGVSWAVVLLMVVYILFQWSPVRVYQGQLGVLTQSERIYPLDDYIYVKVEGTEAPGRERWHFVLVDRERTIRNDTTADFTYYWGEGDRDYTDYFIPIDRIIDGETMDFKFTRKDAEKAYQWRGDRWELASAPPDVQQPFGLRMSWNAYADGTVDLQQLAAKLGSSNRILRARARNELRKLSDAELDRLRQLTDDSEALHQIRLEQQRRTQ